MRLSIKKLSLCLLSFISASGMVNEIDIGVSQRVVATLLALDGYAEYLVGINKKLAILGVFSADFDQTRISLILKQHSREDISPKFKSRIKGRVEAFHELFWHDLHRIEYSPDLLVDEELDVNPRLFTAIEAKRILPNSRLVTILGKHITSVLAMDLRDAAFSKDMKSFEKKVDSPWVIECAWLLGGKLFIEKIIRDSVKFFNVHTIDEALAEHRATWKERAALYKHHYGFLLSCKDVIPESELDSVFSYTRSGIETKIPAALYEAEAASLVKCAPNRSNATVLEEVVLAQDRFLCPDGSYIAFCDDLCAKIVGEDFPADYYVYLEKEPVLSAARVFTHDERVERFIQNSFAQCAKFLKGNAAVRKKAALRKKLPLALELLLDYADFDAKGFVDEKGVAIPNLRLYGSIIPKDTAQEQTECQFEWGLDPKNLATCYHWVAQERPLNKAIAQKASRLSHYKIGALDS